MWLTQNNLDKPRRDKSGVRWHFRVWQDFDPSGRLCTRVFFWDDSKECGGVRIYPAGDDGHVSSLGEFIDQLVAHPALRRKYRRPLRFPLERLYSKYGAFPEDESN